MNQGLIFCEMNTVCKRIIENHKGAMTASGKLNKEGRFDIYIPAI